MTSDEQAIANLMFAYADRIDAGDFDGVGDLFDHAVITFDGMDHRVEGRDAVIDQYVTTTRRYPDGTPRTKHVITNVAIEVEGDTAVGRSYFSVFQQTDVLPLQPIIQGRYHDRFERVEGRWRYAAKKMFVDLVGDMSQHLLIDLDATMESGEAVTRSDA